TKASAKKIYKDNLPTLKKNLKDRKKSAKKEVKAYANELKARYEQDKINLELKLRDAKTDEEITKVKAELDQLKSNYKNSIKITKKEAKKRALEVMREVGIPQPEKRFRQYPFEFSGGMRQRIVIAIALIADPEILICDEPTTALDVTIQAQILELINRIKAERNLSCIFITHDLGVVANMADRVAVMYAGKIVEYGTAEEIFFDPRHPYTWALLASIPDIDSKEKLDAIPGTPPNMVYPPIGDAFALRSKYALAIDFKYEPPYFKVSDTHYAATWLLHKDAPKAEMPKIVSTRIKKALKEGK
ncbi:MAG: ATP-binding cassette domain-containing protein, partial [Bacilli bacterium]|nr:ATP-binding cassette domain-containing protein [Bacilli bacterium]